MNIYLEAFGIFFKIGAFTIGGGYAMVPLIENEIVTKRKWIAQEDFIDLLAISQSAPGILAVNISIFIGYKLRGIRGSIITALGTILPSFIIILAIAPVSYTHLTLPTSDLYHGTIRKNQPLQSVDSCCLGNINLAVGLLPYLDYYCGRCRRFPVGEI